MGPAGRQDKPVFLARGRYRQRRLRDGMLLMPVLAGVLFAVPLLWPRGEIGTELQATANSAALLYLFTVWAGLIVLGAILARFLRRDEDDAPGGPEGRSTPPGATPPQAPDARP